MLPLSADLTEDAAQFVEINRFGQVKIESRRFTPANVLIRPESSNGNSFYRLFQLGFTDDVVAASIWQPDVA